MSSKIKALLMSSVLLAALSAGSPTWAGSVTGSVVGSDTSRSCFAGQEGSCSTSASANPDGSFSGSSTLTSPDNPLSRASRYGLSLARHRIAFELTSPTPEVRIAVDVRIDSASTSWLQETPEIFGGPTSPSSGARTLLQVLGHEAPAGCGCGFISQGSPNVWITQALAPAASDSLSDSTKQVAMTARNVGGGLLPAGRYEVLLRSYALVDLVGSGDWGTLNAQLSGGIDGITVTTAQEPTTMSLSVSGNGANRLLEATLTGPGSTPLSGQTISFFGEGTLIGTGQTNEHGVAVLPVDGKLRGGDRSFRATFDGTDVYEASEAEARS